MGSKLRTVIRTLILEMSQLSAKERLEQIHRTKRLSKKLISLLCDGTIESIYQAIELGGPNGVELLTLKKSWETSYDHKFIFQFDREFGNLLVQHLRKTSQNPFGSHSYTPFFKNEKGTWGFGSTYNEVTISIDK
tara:strand:+ start:504 stop:908 length:405 start_codon:yes stop_codon:yes gene_type:complete